MAVASDRSSLNPDGAWYVDAACVACGLCASIAPSNFRMSDDGSTAFVFKQPTGSAETDESLSALSDCPVQAIGKDG